MRRDWLVLLVSHVVSVWSQQKTLRAEETFCCSHIRTWPSSLTEARHPLQLPCPRSHTDHNAAAAGVEEEEEDDSAAPEMS